MKLSRDSIGSAIRIAREEAKFTLEQVAAKSGITTSTLSRTEQGERDVSFIEVLTLVEIFGITELTLREYAQRIEKQCKSKTKVTICELKAKRKKEFDNRRNIALSR